MPKFSYKRNLSKELIFGVCQSLFSFWVSCLFEASRDADTLQMGREDRE
jgi:hypothetical protein